MRVRALAVVLILAAALVVTITTWAHAAGCTGVVVSGTFTQATVDAHPSGTTFCLAAQTFTQTASITIPSNDVIWGVSKATTVLDGAGSVSQAFIGHLGTQVGVGIKNLSVTGFTGTAIQTGTDWTLNTVSSTYNSVGVEVNDGSVVKNSALTHNDLAGAIGDGAGITLQNDNVSSNNTSHGNTDDWGGMKFHSRDTVNSVITGNTFKNNYGNGIWCDGCGSGLQVTDNVTQGNTGAGIDVEIGVDAVVTGNTLTADSAGTSSSCWQGSALYVNTTPNVTMSGNTVTETSGNGLCVVDAVRSDKYGPVTNLYVHDNIVKVRSPAVNGLAGSSSTFSSGANNRFVHDSYFVTSLSDSDWAWSTYPIGWAAWQGFGQDSTGVVGTW